MKPLVSCPLLLDLASYFPDTEDLLQNKDAREYWLQCFEDATDKVALLTSLAVTAVAVCDGSCLQSCKIMHVDKFKNDADNNLKKN